ncbi:glycosyltransferase, partial [Shewanella colwelliana]|uniref:glycosyltransferase n=1 Tax=Shewanella colwelliana TaxID=23 RepID=UPI001C7DE45A
MTVYQNDKVCQIIESVDSIIQQVGVSVYLVIGVDGAVTIEISDLLKSYETNNRDQVKIHFFSENRGLACTLNELISIYKSEYDFIARMDADDISFNNRLKEQVEYFDNNRDVDVLGTGCIEFSDSSDLDENDLKLKLLPSDNRSLNKIIFTRSPFVHPSVMFRTSVFTDDSIRYPTNLYLSEDLGLWCLMSKKKFVFANLSKPLIYFRINEGTFLRRRGFKKASSELRARLSTLSFTNFYLLPL